MSFLEGLKRTILQVSSVCQIQTALANETFKLEVSSFNTWNKSRFWVNFSLRTRFLAKIVFLFQLRKRVTHRGGITPLKSPNQGTCPPDLHSFITVLDTTGCLECCVKNELGTSNGLIVTVFQSLNRDFGLLSTPSLIFFAHPKEIVFWSKLLY